MTHQANNAPSSEAALYIVATPIGNLQDISARSIQTLKDVDLIACEDTRVSKKLLSYYGIHTPHCSYHEHNAAVMRPKLLARIASGESVALISDAGTPLISDPGYKLVAEAAQQGIRVIPIPGACSVISALMASGLPTDQFAFLGFLPLQRSHAQQMLSLWRAMPTTLICFTTPGKLLANLQVVHETLGECDVVLGREMTKMHEEFIRATSSELTGRFEAENHLRGEIVMAFRAQQPLNPDQMNADKLDALLVDLIDKMPLKAAVDVLVTHFNQPKNQVYQRALELKS